MADNEIDWVPLEFMRWLASCEGMPGFVELTYWRLTLYGYKSGHGTVKGSPQRLAFRCKVTLDEFNEAMEYLGEEGMVDVTETGVFLPSVKRRLDEASNRLDDQRAKTEKGREIATIRRENECSLDEARKIYARRQAGDKPVTTPVTETVTGQSQPVQTNSTDRQTDKETDRQTDIAWHVSPDEALLVWNNTASAHGLAKIDKLTDSRLQHLRKRLKDHNGFQDMQGLDLWSFACSQIQHSQFLLGKTSNSDWRANFDSMVRPDNFAKLIEGGYADVIDGDGGDKPSGGQLQELLNRLG